MEFPEVIEKVEFPGALVLGPKISKGCDKKILWSYQEWKKTNNSAGWGGGGGGAEWLRPPSTPVFFFWNSPLLNGLNPNLGNIAYSGKFSFEDVLSNEDESRIGQLFSKTYRINNFKHVTTY